MISGSRTDSLLACPGPGIYAHVAEDRADGLDKEGSATHAFIPRVAELLALGRDARGDGVDLTDARAAALEDIPPEHRARCESLDLEQLAPFLGAGFDRERGILYHPITGAAEWLPGGTRDEAYKAVPRDERGRALAFPVTPDALGVSGATLVLLELKGRRPDRERTRLQMLTQAVAARAAARGDWVVTDGGAVCFAAPLDDDGNPRFVRWDFSSNDLDTHALALYDAWHAVLEGRRLVDAGGEPALHSGPWCPTCPARAHCPAWSGPRLRLAAEQALTFGDRGAAYVALGTLAAFAEQEREKIRAEAEVTPIPLPDGTELRSEPKTKAIDPDVALAVVLEHFPANASVVLVSHVVRTLSTEAVKDAIRAVAPRREIGRWAKRAMDLIRQAGGVTESSEVRARAPRASVSSEEAS